MAPLLTYYRTLFTQGARRLRGELGIITTEASLITAILAGVAIVVAAIIAAKATTAANSIPTG